MQNAIVSVAFQKRFTYRIFQLKRFTAMHKKTTKNLVTFTLWNYKSYKRKYQANTKHIIEGLGPLHATTLPRLAAGGTAIVEL